MGKGQQFIISSVIFTRYNNYIESVNEKSLNSPEILIARVNKKKIIIISEKIKKFSLVLKK